MGDEKAAAREQQPPFSLAAFVQPRPRKHQRARAWAPATVSQSRAAVREH